MVSKEAIMSDFILSVRGRKGNGYSNRISTAKYLEIPEKQFELSRAKWMTRVHAEAGAEPDICKGNILFFVHGFNTELTEFMVLHRRVVEGLRNQGYAGTVVGFDWPSDGHVLGYASDRLDARAAANLLMTEGIRPFSIAQQPDCDVNLHVLAHSMGCFLVREAFDYADDDHVTAQHSWTMSQVAFVAADISSKSMASDAANSRSLIRHSTRLTNYFSRHDEVLSVSEIKRIGVSRRLGRIGAPENRSDKVVNLDCSAFYDQRPQLHGTRESHSWYFQTPQFYRDLNAVLTSKLDRDVIQGRVRVGDTHFLQS
jgi:esterase/lipase superfamily enzyme